MAKKRTTKPPDTSTPPTAEPLRLEYRTPQELAENPRNWRTHPKAQHTALADVIGEVGWAGVCLFNERTGRLVDGHLRRKVAIETGVERIPVVIGSWDEATEAKILATLDPIGAMAGKDEDQLRELLGDVQTDSQALSALLGELLPSSEQPSLAPDQSDQIEPEYAVFLRCASEADQGVILKELTRHGLPARALTVPAITRSEKQEPDALPTIESSARRITRSVQISRSPRVIQVEGIFDVPPEKSANREWVVDFDLDFPWHIGLIVGPSGAGKSTIASDLFGDAMVSSWPWPSDKALLDGFPESMSPSEITGLLSSVGLSSPPSWLKPFYVLSTGEQFRAMLARTLAESPTLAVVDEFTSVVDRTVARIGSAALAKKVRSTGRRFVAVTCHYDVEDWLQPDWKYDVGTGEFTRRALRRRPDVQLRVRRCDTSTWKQFRHHHYLSGSLHPGATCFLGEVDERPAAFVAVLHSVGKKSFWRESRCVCLPDFQGVGIGNAMSELVAAAVAAKGKAYRSTTSHLAMIAHRARSPLWDLRSGPKLHTSDENTQFSRFANSRAYDRLTTSFQYVGQPRPDLAKQFGLI